MRPSEISLDKLQLGDVSQNGRGGKTASLSVNGKPFHGNYTTPFEVSSYVAATTESPTGRALICGRTTRLPLF